MNKGVTIIIKTILTDALTFWLINIRYFILKLVTVELI